MGAGDASAKIGPAPYVARPECSAHGATHFHLAHLKVVHVELHPRTGMIILRAVAPGTLVRMRRSSNMRTWLTAPVKRCAGSKVPPKESCSCPSISDPAHTDTHTHIVMGRVRPRTGQQIQAQHLEVESSHSPPDLIEAPCASVRTARRPPSRKRRVRPSDERHVIT